MVYYLSNLALVCGIDRQRHNFRESDKGSSYEIKNLALPKISSFPSKCTNQYFKFKFQIILEGYAPYNNRHCLLLS